MKTVIAFALITAALAYSSAMPAFDAITDRHAAIQEAAQ